MNIKIFWSIIEKHRQKGKPDIEAQLETFTEFLSQLPAEDIQEFDRLLWELMYRTYRADLWEAAWLAACGCTDDGFHEFQGWLISQGETIYESVLADPDNLSDVVDKEQRFNIFNGGMTSVAAEAYERKTGHEIPESGYREKAELERPLTPHDQRPAKYPRIIAKLGDCSDEFGT
jgi:hypothetical protein